MTTGQTNTGRRQDTVTSAVGNAYWRIRQTVIELAEAAGAEVREQPMNCAAIIDAAAMTTAVLAATRPFRLEGGGELAARYVRAEQQVACYGKNVSCLSHRAGGSSEQLPTGND
jgi:hypothetical protein